MMRQAKQRKKQIAQLKKWGKADIQIEPHLKQGLSRHAYLAILKRRKDTAKAEMRDLRRGQKAQEAARKGYAAFAKTGVGKRFFIEKQGEASVARARFRKQQAAQFRKQKRNTRQHYSGLGMQDAKLQIKEEGPGIFSVRSTGMSAKVQKHVQLLLNRVKGSITVNGQPMSKKQAFKAIIEILTKRQSALVKIVN